MLENKLELLNVAFTNPSKFSLWSNLRALLSKTKGDNLEFEKAANTIYDKKGYHSKLECLQGLLFELEGDYCESLKSFTNAAKDETLDFAWCMIGYIQATHFKDYEKAEKAYKTAIKLNGNEAMYWHFLGSSLVSYNPGRHKEAEECYSMAIKINPNFTHSMQDLATLLSIYTDRHIEAEELFRRVIQLDGEYPFPYCGLGDLLSIYPNRQEEAELCYKEALELDSSYAYTWAALGNLLINYPSRHNEAEQSYRISMQLDENDALPRYGLGHLLSTNPERCEEVEQLYKMAINIDGNFALPWHGLGKLLSTYPDRSKEAEEAFLKAISLSPDRLSFLVAYSEFLIRDKVQFNFPYLDSVLYNSAYREDTRNFKNDLIQYSDFLNSSILHSDRPLFIYGMYDLLMRHGLVKPQALNLKIQTSTISNSLSTTIYFEFINRDTFSVGLLYYLGGCPAKAFIFLDEFETVQQGSDFFCQFYLHQAYQSTHPFSNDQEILLENVRSLNDQNICSDLLQGYYFVHLCLLMLEQPVDRKGDFIQLINKQLSLLKNSYPLSIHTQFISILFDFKMGVCGLGQIKGFIDECLRIFERDQNLSILIDKDFKVESSNLITYLFLEEVQQKLDVLHDYLLQTSEEANDVIDKLQLLANKMQTITVWDNLHLDESAVIEWAIWEKAQMQDWQDSIRDIITDSSLEGTIFDRDVKVDSYKIRTTINLNSLGIAFEVYIQNKKNKTIAQQTAFWLAVNNVITAEEYCLLSTYSEICYLRKGKINDVSNLISTVISNLLPIAITGLETITNFSVHKAGFGPENLITGYGGILQKVLRKVMPVDDSLKSVTIKQLVEEYRKEKANI